MRYLQVLCRDIDNIKIYGISRIAKDVIETVDHFKQAIKIIEASNAENRLPQVTELKRTLGELAKLLDKYEIHEFSPVN
jgi:molecular chaperone GrpE (heat shock protein)